MFAYGFRNSFGMAFDPRSGTLWEQDNGEDAYDEINRVDAGMNAGWIQTMGPLERVADYRAVEDTALHAEAFPNLQQLRWPPENIATTPAEAASRMFMLPGAHYRDPQFSWRHVVAPAGIGFVDGKGLGSAYDGDLIVGLSVPTPEGGALLRFDVRGAQLALHGGGLRDRVDDNPSFNLLGESAPLLFGRDFGVVTDIHTGPNGNLYVVSLSHGAVYEILNPSGGPSDATSHPTDEAQAPDFAAAAMAGGIDIRLATRADAEVRLDVYDVRGVRVASIHDGPLAAGSHALRWDGASGGTPAPAGVYFVRAASRGTTGAWASTRRVALVR
jgi:hypothetical protein